MECSLHTKQMPVIMRACLGPSFMATCSWPLFLPRWQFMPLCSRRALLHKTWTMTLWGSRRKSPNIFPLQHTLFLCAGLSVEDLPSVLPYAGLLQCMQCLSVTQSGARALGSTCAAALRAWVWRGLLTSVPSCILHQSTCASDVPVINSSLVPTHKVYPSLLSA